MSHVTLLSSGVAAELSELVLPLYDIKVRCGQSRFPSPAQDYELAELDLNKRLIRNPPATFFVKATGDSMTKAGIFPNSILVVNRAQKPKSSHIVIAMVEGELMAKRLYKRGEVVKLLSDSEYVYPPITFTEGQELVIWGVVEHVITSML